MLCRIICQRSKYGIVRAQTQGLATHSTVCLFKVSTFHSFRLQFRNDFGPELLIWLWPTPACELAAMAIISYYLYEIYI